MACYFLFLTLFVCFLALLHTGFKLFRRLTSGWCRSQTCLVGETVIVTGANTGIGYETAIDLAKRGARVILACRNKEKAKQAQNKIIWETGNDKVIVKLVEFTSFKSVRAFAKDINETEDRLDILVNNAGGIALPNTITEDGNLLIMQVNHLSPFLLTNLLGNLLKKTENSRIVNVSSIGAKWSKLDINKLNDVNCDSYIYGRTKLCNIYFTKELAKRLKGTSTTTYSLHPGAAQTDVSRYFVGITKIFLDYVFYPLAKTRIEGAQTQIYLSVAKDIEKYSGEHFHNCKKVNSYKTANIVGIGKKLWEKSEELVKLTANERQL